jgi:hypothetical protein
MGLARKINANNAGIIEATTGHLFTGAWCYEKNHS